jgi:hypothetical protein
MRKTFKWLDNRRFPGDWGVAYMIKQYLRGRRRQITKHKKLTREAEVANLAKERRTLGKNQVEIYTYIAYSVDSSIASPLKYCNHSFGG